MQWGIPGRSNAVVIARRLGLDLEVIKTAQQLISSQRVEDVNQIIRGLEEQRERQQEAAEDAASLLARTELLHEELLDRWNQQRKKSAELEELGRKKLERSIREGQKEVRSLIRRLRDQGASGETARRVGQRLREMENHSHLETVKRIHKDWLPQVGERVRLISIGKAGEVLSISDDGYQLTILCGVFRSNVALHEVESIDGRKPPITRPVVNVKSSNSLQKNSLVRTRKNTLDVRGLRVHEAESVISEKLRNTSGPLWVIHGIGSGKLKLGLREWLETEPYVEKVIDADQIDGGPGCSVIWLR